MACCGHTVDIKSWVVVREEFAARRAGADKDEAAGPFVQEVGKVLSAHRLAKPVDVFSNHC